MKIDSLLKERNTRLNIHYMEEVYKMFVASNKVVFKKVEENLIPPSFFFA